jgi:hypothetical protein
LSDCGLVSTSTRISYALKLIMAGLLFITAPEAKYKNINEALLNMRDWNNSNDDLDVFKLVTNRSARQSNDDGTPIPLRSPPENV